MLTMTPEQSKVTWYISERIRRALAIAAAQRNVAIGDVVAELVTANLPDQLAQADRAIADGTSAGKLKRGRRPKPD